MTAEVAETNVHESPVPWRTISAMLAENVVRHAGRTAIVDGDVRLTYADLGVHVQRIAAGLQARGLGRGDAVALWAPNSWQWVACVAACWWRGCTVVPIPARGRILDALPILQSTRAKLLFTCTSTDSGNLLSLIDEHVRETGASLAQSCPLLATIVDIAGDDCATPATRIETVPIAGFARTVASVACAEVSAEDIATILFTSGSTGRPKGVPRRHAQSLRNRFDSSRLLGYSSADRLLVTSEFSHTLGLHGNLLRSLMLGATLVLARTRNPAEIAALLRAEQVTAMGGAPSLFAALLREQADGKSVCSGLRLAVTGVASIPPALVRDMMAAGIGTVTAGYGMTECDTISTSAPADSAEIVASTVGEPALDVEVQITDEQGVAVAPGVEGEIWVRGYTVTPAYLGANGQLEPAVDAEGWLHSGDMGCFTHEGQLRILGRKKDVITIHGYTLYPAEIEALMTQSGQLQDIAVVGTPHAVAGELCVAFIVPAKPATFSLKALRLWARAHVADYKIPGRFVIVDSLPLNRNGKVDRLLLKSQLQTGEGRDE